MATDRLYYESPHTDEFDATVIAVEQKDDQTLVRLDRTAFYPTTGGQPFDTGQLGPSRVVDVFESEDGDVIHLVEGSGLRIGQHVHAVIDWPRRFDHMQQHTGQHVLSAVIDLQFAVRTVSFHLGAETSTIDLARQLRPVEIEAAEDEANRIVWNDHPVTIRFVSAEEAGRLPLRKETTREGTLRLIDIDRVDLSACGGTHVSRTGAIGMIAVCSWERFKSGQRLEFVCGGRALKRLRRLRDSMAAIVRSLSVLVEDLPSAVDRLKLEGKEQKRTILALQNELARHRADELAAGAEDAPKGRLVLRRVDADAGQLKALASAITTRRGHVAIIVGASKPAQIVIARSSDLDMRSNEVLAALTAKFGGRGGGKADLAQGGGLDAAPEVILDEARRILTLS